MSPDVGKAATRIALFLIVMSLLALRWIPRDSAEFVVTVLVIGIGGIMLGVVAVLARLGR